jgi:hypothetical protein
MLQLVPSFEKMTSEKGRGDPSSMHQEALFMQEGIVRSLCINMFPVLVAGNIIIANMQVKEGTC